MWGSISRTKRGESSCTRHDRTHAAYMMIRHPIVTNRDYSALVASLFCALCICSNGDADEMNLDQYLKDWGVDKEMSESGGLFNEDDSGSQKLKPRREVTLLQRKKGKLGAGLGKTTGWIHR